MLKGFLILSVSRLTSGFPPARPAPGRLASRAALALSVWMAAVPATSRAEEEGARSAVGTTGQETRRVNDTGSTNRENHSAPTPRERRKGRGKFDPKVFEARGRELRGEYYEIPTLAKAPTKSELPAGLPVEKAASPEEPTPRNWILWGGVAGAAACVAGLAGWLLIQQPGNTEPVSVYLDDKP